MEGEEEVGVSCDDRWQIDAKGGRRGRGVLTSWRLLCDSRSSRS